MYNLGWPSYLISIVTTYLVKDTVTRKFSIFFTHLFVVIVTRNN